MTGVTPVEAMNLCFFYHNIFNYENYALKSGMNVTGSATTDDLWEIGQQLLENSTINDMLHFTHGTEEIMNLCMLRNISKDGKITENLKKDECIKYIDVSKFVYGIFVCYRFVFLNSLNNLDPMLISSDTAAPLLVQAIELNKNLLDKVNSFVTIMNEKNTLPKKEIEVSTTASREINPITGDIIKNFFGFRYHTTRSKNLKPPYTTMCKDYSSTDCVTECVNEHVIKVFNRSSPMSNHIFGNTKLVTQQFLNENIDHTRKYLKIVQKCKSNCPWNECVSKVTITYIGESSRLDEFTIYLMLPNTASIIVDTRPNVVPLEYILFVLSCLGTWLGFSFLGCNPFKWKWNILTKQNTSTINISSNESIEAMDFHLLFQSLKRDMNTQKNILSSLLKNREVQNRLNERFDRYMRISSRRQM